jgi:hypothetical protein
LEYKKVHLLILLKETIPLLTDCRTSLSQVISGIVGQSIITYDGFFTFFIMCSRVLICINTNMQMPKTNPWVGEVLLDVTDHIQG